MRASRGVIWCFCSSIVMRRAQQQHGADGVFVSCRWFDLHLVGWQWATFAFFYFFFFVCNAYPLLYYFFFFLTS
jgi:hypothetical protein